MIVNSINERISCKTVVKLRIFLPCLNKGVLYSTLLYYYTTTTATTSTTTITTTTNLNNNRSNNITALQLLL